MELSSQKWHCNADHASKAKFAKFNANYPREYASLFANLERIRKLLSFGNKAGGFNVGIFRSEGGQVYRIGQTRVPSAKESRLYIFPDATTQTIYILGIGVKEGQEGDVNDAKSLVKVISKDRRLDKQ